MTREEKKQARIDRYLERAAKADERSDAAYKRSNDAIDEVSGAKLREKLADNKEKALLSKKLATINCHVPVAFDQNTFLPQPREAEVKELFKRLGFRNLLKRFAAFDRFESLDRAEEAADIPVLNTLSVNDIEDKYVAVAFTYERIAADFRAAALSIAVEAGVFAVPADEIDFWLADPTT